MNISGLSPFAGLASTIQVPVAIKTPESNQDVKGADDQNGQSEGETPLTFFNAFADGNREIASGESPLDHLRDLLESQGFESAPRGEGQGTAGLGLEEKSPTIPNDMKTVDASQKSESHHDQTADLKAWLESLASRLGGGQHSDTPPVAGAEAHLSTSNIS